MLVDVLLPLNFDQTFTYKIDQKAEVGNIVLVSPLKIRKLLVLYGALILRV